MFLNLYKINKLTKISYINNFDTFFVRLKNMYFSTSAAFYKRIDRRLMVDI